MCISCSYSVPYIVYRLFHFTGHTVSNRFIRKINHLFFLLTDHVLSSYPNCLRRQCGNQKTTIIWKNRSSKWTLTKEWRIEKSQSKRNHVQKYVLAYCEWIIFEIENGHIWNEHRKKERIKNDKWCSFVYFIHHYL